MVCAINKINSNISALSFAEEVCLKQLPNTADDGHDPIWYGLEPNNYSDFGGQQTTEARSPIDPTRQNKKGTIVDLDASGGLNHDVVNDPNLNRLLQGFFFADIREKQTTAPMNAAQIVITGAVAATDKYATSATAVAFNKAGLIVKGSNFGVEANNGLHIVVSADTDDITVGNGLADEASPPTNAKLEVVGYQMGSGTSAITKTGNIVALTDSGNQLASLGLIVGEWIFIGGDTLASNRFANNIGFARIGTIAAGVLTFDDIAFLKNGAGSNSGAAEAGTGKTIQIYYGSVLKNESDRALIKTRSVQFERTLGDGATAEQAEYLEGAVANELTLNIPSAKKLNMDVSFVACDNTYRSGETGDEIKSDGAAYVAALGADAYNATSHIYRLKMAIIDATKTNPTPLFGYITEGSINIANGVTPDKAVGVLGALDVSTGNFVLGGSLTALFSTTAAVQAVRNNADVGFNAIVAAKNAGFIYDAPLIGLGGGRINVEKDKPITLPLEIMGAMNPNGYTLMLNMFAYLPNVAMPV